MDEFQDTDRVQSEILRRLGDSSFFRGRMFVVGDTKQSIYRFRGAEPAIFDRWRGEFPEPGRLSLTENFRSVPGVIHFVNALFAECFPAIDSAGQAAGQEHRLTAVRRDHSESPAVTFLWALPAPEADEAEPPGEALGRRAEDQRSPRPGALDSRSAGCGLDHRRPPDGPDPGRRTPAMWPFSFAP